MSPEKDAALCEKYPKIFCDRNAPMNETAMCWGFECGDGWYDLLDTLCGNIQHHIDWKLDQQKRQLENGNIKEDELVAEETLQVVASQVKEKFGGLRFYVTGGDPEIEGMIRMAESMSYKICEGCGHKGSRKGTGWIVTMCSPCWDKRQRRKIGL